MRLRPIPDDELDRLVDTAEAAFAAVIRRAFAAATEKLFRTAKAMTAAGIEPYVSIDDAGVASTIWQQEVPELSTMVQGVYTQAGGAVAATLTARAGVPVPASMFDVLNQHAADHLAQVRNRMVRFGDAAWADIRGQLLEGFTAGEGIEQMTRRLRGISELSQRRARLVARTEVISASNTGAVAGAMSLPAELQPTTKTWLATNDSRTRPTHIAANRQTVAFADKFTVGGVQMAYPGEWGAPAAEVINCLAEGEPVEWFGELEHVTRRWYPGPLLKITTVDGHSLTVTPNHPLLTPAGWQFAKDLRVGGHILGAADRSPNVQHAPPRVEEVHRAARQVGTARRIRGSGVNFHGDGSDGEVEVVRADGDLLAVLDAESVEPSRQLDLVWLDMRPVPLSAQGRLLATALTSPARDSWRGCAARLVRGQRKQPTLVGRHAGHSQVIGLGDSSDLHSDAEKGVAHGCAPDAEFLGDRGDGQTLVVQAVEIGQVDLCSGGHWVFNLSTSSGLLLSDGILHSNCRCTILFDAEPLPGVPEAVPQRSGAAGRRDAAAAQWNVSPAQVQASEADVRRLRDRIRAEAAAVQADSLGWLEKADAYKLRRWPPNAIGRGGEYDWVEALHPDERNRLGRWVSHNDIDAPDVVVQRAIERGAVSANTTVDEFVDMWLYHTRRVDAASTVRALRVPAADRFGGMGVDDIISGLADEGIDASRIVGVDLTDAAGYLARHDLDSVADQAYSLLGPATRADMPPWRMSYQSWEAEVRDLEQAIVEQGRLNTLQRARYDELVPPSIDSGQDFEVLYAEIVETARVADVPVADWAIIPWA